MIPFPVNSRDRLRMDRRSPEENLSKHRDLFKKTSLPWKESYRKRCMDRLKNSRSNFIGRRREQAQRDAEDGLCQGSIIRDVMKEEWQLLRLEQGLPELMDMEQSRAGNDVDDMVATFEEIRLELLREEQQIIAEYEMNSMFEEACMQSTIDTMGPDKVICPVCQKNLLMSNRSIIFCCCGIRIDTEQDCLTLEMVKSNLEAGVSQHSAMCQATPAFGVCSPVGVANLLMTCQTCDFMFIVI